MADPDTGGETAADDYGAEIGIEQDRTLNQIVSTDFAVTALGRAAVVAQVLAGAGVIVWGVLTYLEWHQFHQEGASASEQALGALEAFSVLLFASILGLAAVGCQLAAKWIRLRLGSEYLDEDDEGVGSEEA